MLHTVHCVNVHLFVAVLKLLLIHTTTSCVEGRLDSKAMNKSVNKYRTRKAKS